MNLWKCCRHSLASIVSKETGQAPSATTGTDDSLQRGKQTEGRHGNSATGTDHNRAVNANRVFLSKRRMFRRIGKLKTNKKGSPTSQKTQTKETQQEKRVNSWVLPYLTSKHKQLGSPPHQNSQGFLSAESQSEAAEKNTFCWTEQMRYIRETMDQVAQRWSSVYTALINLVF